MIATIGEGSGAAAAPAAKAPEATPAAPAAPSGEGVSDEQAQALRPNVELLPVLADAYRGLRRWREVERIWDEIKALSPAPEVLAERSVDHRRTALRIRDAFVRAVIDAFESPAAAFGKRRGVEAAST